MEDIDWDDAVRMRAYHIWESSGRPDSQHETHWQQALRELGLLPSVDDEANAQTTPTADKPASEEASGSP